MTEPLTEPSLVECLVVENIPASLHDRVEAAVKRWLVAHAPVPSQVIADSLPLKRHDDHKVLRFEVPVDDRWHTIQCDPGPMLFVASRDESKVEFWQEVWLEADAPVYKRKFIVVGTGHAIPVGARWRGTAITAGGALVWHLYEKG